MIKLNEKKMKLKWKKKKKLKWKKNEMKLNFGWNALGVPSLPVRPSLRLPVRQLHGLRPEDLQLSLCQRSGLRQFSQFLRQVTWTNQISNSNEWKINFAIGQIGQERSAVQDDVDHHPSSAGCVRHARPFPDVWTRRTAARRSSQAAPASRTEEPAP